jgi:hypothetical protein
MVVVCLIRLPYFDMDSVYNADGPLRASYTHID